MVKTLDKLVISTALAGTLFVPGCADNKVYSERYNPQGAYSQQKPEKEPDFESRLRRIIEEENYSGQLGPIEENLISHAPRNRKEKEKLRARIGQIDLTAHADDYEREIAEEISKGGKPELTPVERVVLRAYGLNPDDTKSRFYLHRESLKAASEEFKYLFPLE